VPEASAAALGRTLRLVRDRGLPREPELPIERGASEDEILSAEDDLVLESVRWAQQAVKREERGPGSAGNRPFDAAQGGPVRGE
jgi:hypothetical protein